MTSSKSEKASPSRQEPTNAHIYPDWTTMQAYCGPGVPLPPYLNSTVMAGHVPHPQMWGPMQAMMAPYGVPYHPVYPPGVVYAHPAAPLVAAPLSTQPSCKTDEVLTKKLKTLDAISMQVLNDGAEVDGEGSACETSQSLEQGFDTSGNKSDANVKDERQLKRERRKQANRESARRSRMRKQAEIEELMATYETLKVENVNMNLEINKLLDESEKLRVENASLMEKLDGDVAARPEKVAKGKTRPSVVQPNHITDEFLKNCQDSFTKGSESDTLQNSHSDTNLQTFESGGDAVPTS